jgi:hypothetical protein
VHGAWGDTVRNWKSGLAIVVVLVSVIGIYVAYYSFLLEGYHVSTDKDGGLVGVRSGTFGDAFGTLNALFSGLAFSGVLITLLLQRKDLADSQQQNAKQQTESQFYNMLSLQQQVIQGFDLHVNRNDTQYTLEGRDCFRDWHRKLQRIYNNSGGEGRKTEFRAGLSFQQILQSHQGDLGLYFRSLYSVFRFIELAEYADKKHLGRVVRSLLSDYELVFLYYNCLSGKGEKFRKYADFHQLFDNLDISLLLDLDHVLFMNAKAFGDNKEALSAIKDFQEAQ